MRDRGPCWPRGTALPRASGPLCTPLLLEARIEGSRCPELVPAPAPQAGGSRVSHRQLSNELSLPSIGLSGSRSALGRSAHLAAC